MEGSQGVEKSDQVMPGFGIEDDELKKLFAEAGEAVKKARVTPSEGPMTLDTPPAGPRTPSPSPPSREIFGSPAARPRTPSPSPPARDIFSSPAAQPRSSGSFPVPSSEARSSGSFPIPSKEARSSGSFPVPSNEARSSGSFRIPSNEARSSGAIPIPAAAQGGGSDEFTLEPVARPAAAPAPADGTVRLSGGEQTDAALVARTTGGATVTIPWTHIKALTLGRVAERSVLAFLFNGTVYYFNDENVVYKGLLRQMATTLTLNWRSLVNEIASHVADKSDPGIAAMTGSGGMVPKFYEMSGLLNALRAR